MSDLIIDSGKSGLTISSGVYAYVYSGAVIRNCKVASGGRLYIYNGAASGTVVSKGGLMAFVQGCSSGGVNTVLSGGTAIVSSGAKISTITASNGAALVLYATASSYYTPATVFTVSSGGSTIKCTGSSFSGWENMNTPGCKLVLAGVSASSIKVSSGCSLTIGGESRYASASVNKVNVYNGGMAFLTRVDTVGSAAAHAGGSVFVADGATTSAMIVENGGKVTLYYGNEMLNDPGYNIRIRPNTFYNVIASGYDRQDVTAHSGTTGVNTRLVDSAYFYVYSGGRAVDTVTAGGNLVISYGGVASNVYNNAGMAWVSSGGKITGRISINHRLFVDTGGIIDFDISGIRGGDAARFDNYYNIPTNTGSPTLTLTVSGRQPDGTYTLATGAWQIEKKTTNAEKTVTIYNTSGKMLGSVLLGQTVKIGSANYSLNLQSGYLSVSISGSAPADPAKSDIDATNKSDILFQYTGGDYQTGYWMNGTNTWKGQGVLHSKDWKCLGAYDMNANGKADTVYIGNTTVNGVKGAYVGYYTDGVDKDANWKNIGFLTNAEGIKWNNAVGNLTGTYAKNDIVWHAASLGVLGLWTDGTANWKSLGSGFDSKWAIVGTGDFNGYGMDCVYMSHDGGNNYYMVDVNGTITHMGASTGGWKVVAIGDFYGDGKEDVIAFNEKYGLVDVWSDGKTTVDVNIGQLNAKDWFVAGAGDYNGDGKDDLLVRQKSTGMLGYYAGANMKSGWKTLGYGVSTAWTVIA